MQGGSDFEVAGTINTRCSAPSRVESSTFTHNLPIHHLYPDPSAIRYIARLYLWWRSFYRTFSAVLPDHEAPCLCSCPSRRDSLPPPIPQHGSAQCLWHTKDNKIL